MDFSDTPEEGAFRKEVRKFIAEEAPEAAKGLSGEEALVGNWAANQVNRKNIGWATASNRASMFSGSLASLTRTASTALYVVRTRGASRLLVEVTASISTR